MSSGTDLVVFSHLRWDGVWQRPHHLVTRLAAVHLRTFFVEEPVAADVPGPCVRCVDVGPVTRVIPQVPQGVAPRNGEWLTFADIDGREHQAVVAEACGRDAERNVWLYSPLALPLAQGLQRSRLAYDVMDDLASFAGASAEMKLRQAQALSEADVVFTGGLSLHEGVLDRRRRVHGTFCFPSGVDIEHFRAPRIPNSRPVAGYIGVIDERVDLELVARLADALPDWTVRMVGPVTKIPAGRLPQRANIEYPGKKSYAELPGILAGFDVALMPFAINEATRSISPTKTLEYFAAGLPIVSTRIRDVERDCGDLVTFASDPQSFARSCVALRGRAELPNPPGVEALLRARRWDAIANQMLDHLMPPISETQGGMSA